MSGSDLIERVDAEVGGVIYPDPRGGMLQEAAARIRELEAERDWLAKRSDNLQTHANAIEAATIVRCEQALRASPYLDEDAAAKAIEVIRATRS